MGRFQICGDAISDVGRHRKNNEDNYFVNGKTVSSAMHATAYAAPTEQNVFAVFDGMGGEQAGELASQAAANVFCTSAYSLLKADFAYGPINALVQEANRCVCALAKQCQARVGTTLAMLAFREDRVVVANVGDSRIYRLTGGVLQQLSKDHTQAQALVEGGVLSKEDAEKRPEKHKLTQHLGIFPEEMVIEPYVLTFPAVLGDRFLLCSDGLTDMLTDAQIQQILSADLPTADLVARLVQQALDYGGKDNTTVMVLEVSEGSEDTRASTEELCLSAEQTDSAPLQPMPTVPKKKKFLLWSIIGVLLAILTAALSVFAIKTKDGGLAQILHNEHTSEAETTAAE